MPFDTESILEKYANLVIRVGLNLQPGQKLLIKGPLSQMGTPLSTAPLIRAIVKQAYQAEAKLVDVMWHDTEIELIRLEHAPKDSFGEYPSWRADAWYEIASKADAALFIYGSDPDLLQGQNPEYIDQTLKIALEKTTEARSFGFVNGYNWLIIAYPDEVWAARVLPDEKPEDQLKILQDAMIKILRLDQDDPIEAWDAHLKNLELRRDYLNSKQYVGLHYSAPGTDLKVGLPENHLWGAARFTTQGGITWTANLPTEEVFTIPHKDKTEGYVTATKPLSHGGSLVDEFSVTFENGKVVKVTAKKGETVLNNILDTDEGSRRLGEVALVPHSSPISQSGLLFFNTLFDENASNHLALGRAFKFALVDGIEMSDEAFEKAGGNHSINHVDFMIGSGEMDVDGIKEDGGKEAVMRNGEWAFEV